MPAKNPDHRLPQEPGVGRSSDGTAPQRLPPLFPRKQEGGTGDISTN